jgi:hypothetical protein
LLLYGNERAKWFVLRGARELIFQSIDAPGTLIVAEAL